MPSPQSAAATLDQCFLEVRARLLDVAAALDRIDRAEGAGTVSDDPRLRNIARALEIVSTQHDNRAEQIQLLFSDEYTPGWNRS